MIPPPIFDEQRYLDSNPDVAQAIRNGAFSSGWQHFQMYGRLEGRAHGDVSLPREAKVLQGLDREGQGLEIGPSHRPIAPKSEGFRVHVLDYLDAPALREKYGRHGHLGVDVSRIEEVDFVWKGGPLQDTIGEEGCYDWIIASHVIEHVPDLVAFLQQCSLLLKPAGKLALVVPHRQYCFDALNTLSSTGEVIDAHLGKRMRPTPGQVFDQLANSCRLDDMIAWGPGLSGTLKLQHEFAAAERMSKVAAEQYVDVHCWRFSQPSFHLIVSDLQHLRLIDLGVVSQFPLAGCEFFMTLARVPAESARPVDRLTALQQAA